MRKDITQYYASLLEENSKNPKHMWKTVNSILERNSKTTSVSTIKFEGQLIQRPKLVVESFNEHFVSVGAKLASKIETDVSDDPASYLKSRAATARFQFELVTVKHIRNLIRQLQCSKSPGSDKVPVKIIKDAIDAISLPLALIFNSSLQNGTFPKMWKVARVVPIFKSSQRTEVNNYRPISVLSVLSRLLVKIVYDQIYDFVKEHKIMSADQFAVCSLLNTTESWCENINNRKLYRI